MDADELYARYQDLQAYVGWSHEDAARIQRASEACAGRFGQLVEDFYNEIDRHPHARAVITGGMAQVQRLKGTLRSWLLELFAGRYDRDYVERRWRVGKRHVELGLEQVYTNMALARLRMGLQAALAASWRGPLDELIGVQGALNRLLDLDLAIIEDAYQAEYRLRQQRSERLATIGHMAGGVAHELRNPLNVVRTSVYYLLNAKHITPEKTTEHLTRIERQVCVADGVITALADYARLPFPELEAVSLTACVEAALEDTPPPPGITVEKLWSADLPDVMGDAAQLRIVAGNLIRNAFDAMPQGGRLTLRAQPEGSQVMLAVQDSGVGIPRHDLERIMEPLFTTKARGIGLGLSITRGIIDKHHGQLSVDSEPGQGSTFYVRLAAAGAPQEP